MILVIDTNRIIAALIKDSISRSIILSGKIEFITLNFGKKEIEKYKEEIIQKASIDEEQFNQLLQRIFGHVKIIPDEIVKKYLSDAKEIMDHIDPDDTFFIAAALAYNTAIWSDDNHFQQQKRIKTWKTKDIIKYLEMM